MSFFDKNYANKCSKIQEISDSDMKQKKLA